MSKHTAALKFLKKSKQWSAQRLENRLAELPKEQRDNLPSPWTPGDTSKDPQGAKAAFTAWLARVGAAQTKLRRAVGEASKRHARAIFNSCLAAREQERRLVKTDRIFRELLGSRRTN